MTTKNSVLNPLSCFKRETLFEKQRRVRKEERLFEEFIHNRAKQLNKAYSLNVHERQQLLQGLHVASAVGKEYAQRTCRFGANSVHVTHDVSDVARQADGAVMQVPKDFLCYRTNWGSSAKQARWREVGESHPDFIQRYIHLLKTAQQRVKEEVIRREGLAAGQLNIPLIHPFHKREGRTVARKKVRCKESSPRPWRLMNRAYEHEWLAMAGHLKEHLRGIREREVYPYIRMQPYWRRQFLRRQARRRRAMRRRALQRYRRPRNSNYNYRKEGALAGPQGMPYPLGFAPVLGKDVDGLPSQPCDCQGGDCEALDEERFRRKPKAGGASVGGRFGPKNMNRSCLGVFRNAASRYCSQPDDYEGGVYDVFGGAGPKMKPETARPFAKRSFRPKKANRSRFSKFKTVPTADKLSPQPCDIQGGYHEELAGTKFRRKSKVNSAVSEKDIKPKANRSHFEKNFPMPYRHPYETQQINNEELFAPEFTRKPKVKTTRKNRKLKSRKVSRSRLNEGKTAQNAIYSHPLQCQGGDYSEFAGPYYTGQPRARSGRVKNKKIFHRPPFPRTKATRRTVPKPSKSRQYTYTESSVEDNEYEDSNNDSCFSDCRSDEYDNGTLEAETIPSSHFPPSTANGSMPLSMITRSCKTNSSSETYASEVRSKKWIKFLKRQPSVLLKFFQKYPEMLEELFSSDESVITESVRSSLSLDPTVGDWLDFLKQQPVSLLNFFKNNPECLQDILKEAGVSNVAETSRMSKHRKAPNVESRMFEFLKGGKANRRSKHERATCHADSGIHLNYDPETIEKCVRYLVRQTSSSVSSLNEPIDEDDQYQHSTKASRSDLSRTRGFRTMGDLLDESTISSSYSSSRGQTESTINSLGSVDCNYGLDPKSHKANVEPFKKIPGLHFRELKAKQYLTGKNYNVQTDLFSEDKNQLSNTKYGPSVESVSDLSDVLRSKLGPWDRHDNAKMYQPKRPDAAFNVESVVNDSDTVYLRGSDEDLSTDNSANRSTSLSLTSSQYSSSRLDSVKGSDRHMLTEDKHSRENRKSTLKENIENLVRGICDNIQCQIVRSLQLNSNDKTSRSKCRGGKSRPGRLGKRDVSSKADYKTDGKQESMKDAEKKQWYCNSKSKDTQLPIRFDEGQQATPNGRKKKQVLRTKLEKSVECSKKLSNVFPVNSDNKNINSVQFTTKQGDASGFPTSAKMQQMETKGKRAALKATSAKVSVPPRIPSAKSKVARKSMKEQLARIQPPNMDRCSLTDDEVFLTTDTELIETAVSRLNSKTAEAEKADNPNGIVSGSNSWTSVSTQPSRGKKKHVVKMKKVTATKADQRSNSEIKPAKIDDSKPTLGEANAVCADPADDSIFNLGRNKNDIRCNYSTHHQKAYIPSSLPKRYSQTSHVPTRRKTPSAPTPKSEFNDITQTSSNPSCPVRQTPCKSQSKKTSKRQPSKAQAKAKIDFTSATTAHRKRNLAQLSLHEKPNKPRSSRATPWTARQRHSAKNTYDAEEDPDGLDRSSNVLLTAIHTAVHEALDTLLASSEDPMASVRDMLTAAAYITDNTDLLTSLYALVADFLDN